MLLVVASVMYSVACGNGIDIYQQPDADKDFSKWDVMVQDAPFRDTGHDDSLSIPDVILLDPGKTDPGKTDYDIKDPGPQDTGWDLSDVWGSDIQYTGIYTGAGVLEGQALVSKLCALVKSGYQGEGYDDAKDLSLEYVDEYNGKVRAVYKGDWVYGGKGLNHEHTWPQSKGAGSGDAKSDLFHLFPTHPQFNSARGNLTFGLVKTKNWPDGYVGDPDCGETFPGHAYGCFSIRGWDQYGVLVFEPRDGQKGDTARAVLYFSIRYGKDCKVKSLGILDSYHPDVTEALLKTWNALDPPDENEQTRNDRIETIEKVRNPFIDHPEFIDRISFQ